MEIEPKYTRVIDGDTYKFYDSNNDGRYEIVEREFNLGCGGIETLSASGKGEFKGVTYEGRAIQSISDGFIKDLFDNYREIFSTGDAVYEIQKNECS